MKYAVEKVKDKLSGIVLPKNMREYYGIYLNDKIKLVPTDDGILVMKSDSCSKEKKDKKPVE